MTRDEQIRELLEELRSDTDMDGDHDRETCGGEDCPVCIIDKIDALLQEKPCKTCGGSGRKKWEVTEDWPHEYTICPDCKGAGTVPDCQKPECPVCKERRSCGVGEKCPDCKQEKKED